MGDFEHKQLPDDMVNEGWREMRHLLDLHSPVKAKPSRRFLVRWIAAAMFILFVASTVVFMYRPARVSVEEEVSSPTVAFSHSPAPGSAKENIVESEFENIGSSENFREKHPDAVKKEFVKARNEAAEDNLESRILPHVKALAFTTGVEAHNPFDISNIESVSVLPQRAITYSLQHDEQSDSESTGDVSRLKPSFYVGAAINFSGKKSISFENRSVHPVMGAQLNVTNRLFIEGGFALFSAVSRKQQVSIGKEYVYNRADDIYYRNYTTDVVRVNYIDIPVTLNYRVTNSFVLGAGMEISRLYKSRIYEKKETYNFSEEITSAEQSTFMSSSSTVGSFPRQVEVSGWDPRFLLQAGWSKGNWEAVGKYHAGLQNAVKILNGGSVMHEYDNTFMSLELRYRLGKK